MFDTSSARVRSEGDVRPRAIAYRSDRKWFELRSYPIRTKSRWRPRSNGVRHLAAPSAVAYRSEGHLARSRTGLSETMFRHPARSHTSPIEMVRTSFVSDSNQVSIETRSRCSTGRRSPVVPKCSTPVSVVTRAQGQRDAQLRSGCSHNAPMSPPGARYDGWNEILRGSHHSSPHARR
jgi:hypothetical protein